MSETPKLKRSLSLSLIILYGLGTTIGAGIFALLGKVVGHAGSLAPVSFLVASVLAAFTAFSFAELSARYPVSAGEAVYVREGFGGRTLPLIVGLLVALAGIVSAAAIINGAIGYLQVFLPLGGQVLIIIVVVVLGVVTAWGITQSVGMAALFTVVEIAGLGLIIWAGAENFADLPDRLGEFAPALDAAAWPGILIGGLLAFYAFLGFEDMVNVAEEVKGVRTTLPKAIIITLVVTTLLYAAVSLVAVLTVAPAELALSPAPFALLFERATGASPAAISLISIAAIVNGALIQMIMASRVLYGLANQAMLTGALAKAFARIHPVTRTPLNATAVVAGCILVLALGFPIEPLAGATSMLALVIFTLVNLALVRIKRKDPRPTGITVYPTWIPVLGALASAGFFIFAVAEISRS